MSLKGRTHMGGKRWGGERKKNVYFSGLENHLIVFYVIVC